MSLIQFPETWDREWIQMCVRVKFYQLNGLLAVFSAFSGFGHGLGSKFSKWLCLSLSYCSPSLRRCLSLSLSNRYLYLFCLGHWLNFFSFAAQQIMQFKLMRTLQDAPFKRERGAKTNTHTSTQTLTQILPIQTQTETRAPFYIQNEINPTCQMPGTYRCGFVSPSLSMFLSLFCLCCHMIFQ